MMANLEKEDVDQVFDKNDKKRFVNRVEILNNKQNKVLSKYNVFQL
jgi:hypothetical protein